MNGWIAVAGAGAGLGLILAFDEIAPPAPRLEAALARLATPPPPQPRGLAPRSLARQLTTAAPWLLRVPSADLRLLGRDTDTLAAAKIICFLAGVAAPSVLSALLALTGTPVTWTIPVAASLATGAACFVMPDLTTRARAARKRAEFLHAMTSYVDLVVIERGAGAGPTETLEAPADIGGGWAFARIRDALAQARHQGTPPWAALARLGAEIGVPELTDLADIAGIAGREGARIQETLEALAASIRAESLAATRARASSRSTTMVIPIALLGAGFLLLLIFPIVYRTFGPG
jgi:Flp pilus assembly protein TadB